MPGQSDNYSPVEDLEKFELDSGPPPTNTLGNKIMEYKKTIGIVLAVIGVVILAVVGVSLGLQGSGSDPRCPIKKDCVEVTKAVGFTIKIQARNQPSDATTETLPDEIVIGLFGRDAPKTVENFYNRSLKLGPDGQALEEGYEGSKFYEIDESYIKAGDFKRNDGSDSSPSVFGDVFQEATNANTNTTYGTGWVSMNPNSNSEPPHSYGSLFRIMVLDKGVQKVDSWLQDPEKVVFGKVLKGMKTVRRIKDEEKDEDDNIPLKDVVIAQIRDVPLTEVQWEPKKPSDEDS